MTVLHSNEEGEVVEMINDNMVLVEVRGVQPDRPRLVSPCAGSSKRAAGHESGIAYDLSEPVTLGRGDVEIRLEDPFASSQHVRISREGHTVVIEDLGSTNGTFLNDSPLTGPQPLHDGDRIRIGDSEFQYLQ